MRYRIVWSELFPPFDIFDDKANIIAIERPAELYSFVSELNNQITGGNGSIVLSSDGEVLRLSSKAELVTQFFPLELNSRRILNKLYLNFEKKAMSPEFYGEQIKLNSAVNSFMNVLTCTEIPETQFGSVNLSALFKAVDLRINDSCESLEERVIDYMTNVCALEGERIFVFLNLLNFIDREKREVFFETVIAHGFFALFVEASSVEPMPIVNQMIVDEDLCII